MKHFVEMWRASHSRAIAFCLNILHSVPVGDAVSDQFLRLGISTSSPATVDGIAFAWDPMCVYYIALRQTKTMDERTIRSRWETVLAILSDTTVTKIAFDIKCQLKSLLTLDITGMKQFLYYC